MLKTYVLNEKFGTVKSVTLHQDVAAYSVAPPLLV